MGEDSGCVTGVGDRLSHNNGKADAHDLIPANVWFAPYITDWSERYFVTYESLPEMRSAYERLDKRRGKPNFDRFIVAESDTNATAPPSS
jgi:hypothetical protein